MRRPLFSRAFEPVVVSSARIRFEEIVMRRLLIALAASSLIAVPATAALKVGTKAPDFTTTGAVGGKEFKLHLAQQLKKGPVVIYFFPKAFTSGCTAEAHAFSESIGDFKKAGAQVIGMSADDLKTLHDFSAKECRSAFPVATATPEIQKAYDVAWAAHPGITTRTSYVIDRSGKVVMVHDDLDFSQHVAKTLAAVKALKH
jgi:peroxiredoxin